MQINQAAGRLDSKRRMKNAAYAEIDQIIFQLYLAYSDEPRPASYIDELGRRQNSTFNRYDFIERDEGGEYYYNDEYIFSADASIDVERSRELMWEGHRRTDLIRFGLFHTDEYLWPYKGGDDFSGQAFPAYKCVFALPPTELAANPYLQQNPGY